MFLVDEKYNKSSKKCQVYLINNCHYLRAKLIIMIKKTQNHFQKPQY